MEAPEENSIKKTNTEKNSGICIQCGRLYTSNRTSKKYCSDSCKTLACNAKKKEKRLAALKQSQINQANRQRIHQEKLARKAENEAKQLAALSEQVKQRQDHFEKLQAEKKALDEKAELLALEHRDTRDLLQFKEQLRKDQYDYNQEMAKRRRAARKQPKFIVPSGLKPRPEINTGQIIEGATQFIKAFLPKTDQDLQ